MKEAIVQELISLLKRVRNNDPNVQEIVIDYKVPLTFVRALLHAVPKSIYIRRMVLTQAGCTDEIAEGLQYCIQNSPSLVELDLSRNRLSNRSCQAIAQGLLTSKILQKLNLTRNHINDEGIQYLCGALLSSATTGAEVSLTSLRLGRNQFGVPGVQALAALIQDEDNNASSLLTLDLRGNRIGNQGAFLIAQALKSNASLHYLYLQSNEIDNEGVEALASSLRHNTVLRTLDLQSNPITDHGATAFVESLHTNDNFIKLKIKNTQVSDEIKNQLLDLLVINSYGPELARQTKEAAENLDLLYCDSLDISSSSAHSASSTMTVSECVICFDKLSDTAFLPCKHYSCCQSCAVHLKACHMCRSPIVKLLTTPALNLGTE